MQKNITLEYRCKELVVELGLGTSDEVISAQPLAGGVASDIAMVDLGDHRICVKFALAKLKVAEDWYAPVHRNKAEYHWLRMAAEISPDSALKLLGRSEIQNGFAMEYLAGEDVYLWKIALLQAQPDNGEAVAVGDVIGQIHAASARSGFDTSPFENRDDFQALRLEPYLRFTATRHPALADHLNGLADRLYASQQVLVHGDVSPKNILFRAGKPVILDAECATMGDASFDVAFCLNHLLLKAVHMPASRHSLLAAVEGFWRAYSAHINWETPEALEARVSALLPMLMLARIDGKSPVEYLSDQSRQQVRDLATPLIEKPEERLSALTQHLDAKLEGTEL